MSVAPVDLTGLVDLETHFPKRELTPDEQLGINFLEKMAAEEQAAENTPPPSYFARATTEGMPLTASNAEGAPMTVIQTARGWELSNLSASPPAVSGAALRAPEAEIPVYRLFDAATELAGAAVAAEWFALPGGSGVWVHAVTPMQSVWLSHQSERHIAALYPKTGDPQREYAAQLLPMVWQVIACCRKGPEPEAAPVFDAAQADALVGGPFPGIMVIKQIVMLSNRLGERGAEEIMSPGTALFFGGIGNWLATCASQLNAATLESTRAMLTACALSAGRIWRRQSLSGATLPEWTEAETTEGEPEDDA